MSYDDDLAAFLSEAWTCLELGLSKPDAAAKLAYLATVDHLGFPKVRAVSIVGLSREEMVVEIHSDTSTQKVLEIEANPQVSFCVWDPERFFQIRVDAQAEVLTGPLVMDRWFQVPEHNRVSYGSQPEPGTPIAKAFDYSKPPTPERFAVLLCHVQSLDIVHLEPNKHRRAKYENADGWLGHWCAP